MSNKDVQLAAVRSPSTSSSGNDDAAETLDLFDQIIIDDNNERESSDGGKRNQPKRILRECSLKDNPNLSCYCRFVAALHAIGHAIAKLPCCYRMTSSHKCRKMNKIEQPTSIADN